MNVAIVHYHLGPGGVSQVIRTTSAAFTEAGIPHVILVGEEAGDSSHLPLLVVPGLAYLDSPGGLTAATLAARLKTAARGFFGEAPGIWHFHNHSLGKNQVLTEVIPLLAAENERLILQIHDLAEDGRPALYQKISNIPDLYPFSPRIRYAFLNPRDRQTFITAGLPAENTLELPNPVQPPAQAPASRTGGSALLFAPIRAIRRKNPGELVFLAVLSPGSTRIAISRAPRDPEALRIHDTWRNFAREFAVRIEFDVTDRIPPADGASADFGSWIEHSTHICGTSVSEGFGLPFLEAASWHRPFVGRNLAYLAHDLPGNGLYERLLVPAEWIGRSILLDHLATTLERNHRAWRRPLARSHIDATFDTLWGDGWLDFGNLPEPLQQGVIERCTDPAQRRIPLVETSRGREQATTWLAAALGVPFSDRAAVIAPSVYQKRLSDLHTTLAAAPAGEVGFVPPTAVLTPHLQAAAFHFLRSIPKPEVRRPTHFRAVIFDIYGTLLIAPPGGVKADPAIDPVLANIILSFGQIPPKSPSTALHDAVLRHHAASAEAHPEIDLRKLWREVLALDPFEDVTPLVIAIENAWHPARLMPGAEQVVQFLAASGISLGLLSNAQCNTLPSLGGIAALFDPELTVLSYQHGLAKPSPRIFGILTDRLARCGIAPAETIFVGNDPLHDIVPAAAHGFMTAHFTGHPDSLRPGDATADFLLDDLKDLLNIK